ncbi:ABC1 kinase family protein [Myxococcus landrumensis]|uniref:AarF/ABC1/UbiB kinase family protein n=1 Tax=Myxococcus landrumensis TaxID=2813577 RepID=A0ABX7N7W1_9BACT|nr:AarF/ABC1/UbiB kinase family protein [Myxococcus landrumus]QSQ14571.1 AarF/ABC1/UbiB kinase family protein [Myxococcus landrumus]
MSTLRVVPTLEAPEPPEAETTSAEPVRKPLVGARRVSVAVRRWRQREDEDVRIEAARVLGRQLRERAWDAPPTPHHREAEQYRASIGRTLQQLGVWIFGALWLLARIGMDVIRRQDSIQARGKNLRRLIERAGGTWIKLGQQLAIRVDLLPYPVAQELEKMLDAAPPIAFSQVRRIVEHALQRPISEVFSELSEEPVGSGSVACVYRAVLHGGDVVAVKVRRPGVGSLFAADMRALGWILWLAELWFVPPGYSRQLLHELSTMLYEELDFIQEARYTELFQDRMNKLGQRFVRSPHVYGELSNSEVLVTEFVSGIWLKDLISAAERQDAAGLTGLAELGIVPRKVARRLLKIARLCAQEGLFFHADLHPANVVVQPDSRLVLIDFGSCGAFTARERRVWREIADAQANEDVGRMVAAVLALLEPLPSVDVEEFSRKLETVFWQDLYANKSRTSRWWERTSANLWIGFFKLAQEYRVPMNLNTLRMIRSTMLSDSLAARLEPRIDHYREFRRYEVQLGKRMRQRLVRKLNSLSEDRSYIRYEQLYEAAMAGFYRFQRFLDSSTYRFAVTERMFSFALSQTLRAGTFLLLGALLVRAGTALRRVFREGHGVTEALTQEVLSGSAWSQTFSSPLFVGAALVMLAVTLRGISFRLSDKDREAGSRTAL